MQDYKPGDVVKFSADEGELVGIVQRTWGTRAVNVTIKTDEDKPRTFVRLADRITPLYA